MGTAGDPTGPIPPDRMVKPIDAWWTVLLVDPVATRIVPPLSRRSWVTPTRVTLAAHALGLVCVALYATEALLLAAVVFEVRFLLDCVDGKLARVTGRSSVAGGMLDAFGDRILLMAMVAALGWRYEPAAVAIVLGAYPLHFHLLETRNELQTREGTAGSGQVATGRWGRALAARRLHPIPISVDVEHVLFVVVPVAWVAGLDVVGPALWAVAAYFAGQCARYGLSVVRTGARLDRAAGARGRP
jgi:phosphatidylglycerophosphate synthase